MISNCLMEMISKITSDWWVEEALDGEGGFCAYLRGEYLPGRFDTQNDAAKAIINAL
ncbi:hypothetical protein G3D64_004217 [Salmonella enterica subsp. enterica serovar Cerro]|nr:hypothetical protein [Salmonella enterica subsp. enterica serovar Cerro]